MIQVVGVYNTDTEISVDFFPSVRTYNIVSGLMSDECRPYRVAERVMIWFDPCGYLGEVESIYPPMVEGPLSRFHERIEQESGFPQFEIHFDKDIDSREGSIQPLEDGFIIWLARDKIIDRTIHYKSVQFLLAGNELVAIEAHEMVIGE